MSRYTVNTSKPFINEFHSLLCQYKNAYFPSFGNASQTSRFIFRTWKFYIEKLSILYKSRLRTQKTVRNLLDLGVEETGDVVALCFGSKASRQTKMKEAPVDAAEPRRQMRMSTSTGSSPTNARPWTTKGETARSTPPTAAHRCAPMESPTVADRS